ncbi:MAG: branched-chain amino acid aminotransferase [Rhodospirillales bacterium]|nr:branched-chain amino acid aminotransferase [Rhodospirillales bacterium]
MDQLTYHQGSFHEGNPMIMGPLDQSFWFATMIFDGARAFDGVMPDIERHCQRCLNSAQVMGMEPKETVEDLVELAGDMARRFPSDKQLYIRPTYWSGQSDSLWEVADLTRFLMVLEVAPMEEPTGFSTCLSELRRPAPDMAPTLAKASCLYPTSGDAVRRARAKGFDNAVMLDFEGNVAEFATSNLFFAKDGQVHTPADNKTFLAGITRKRVISLLQDAGYDVVERSVTYDEVTQADEVFSTGNYSKVIPVTRVDDRDLQPGPVYRKARELYFEFARDEGTRL